MKGNIVETAVGALVLCVAVILLGYAYVYTHTTGRNGYVVTAQFDHIDGLSVGSDVRLGGIKVGHVQSMVLDPKSYMADVTIYLDPSVRIPTDTSAQVTSDSLLGGRHLALVPGGADQMLAPGEAIGHTQSPINLESLIGQVIFGSSKSTPSSEKGSASSEAGSVAGASGPSPTAAAA